MMHLGDPFSRQSWDKPVKQVKYTLEQEAVLDELGEFRSVTLQETSDEN